MNFNKYIPSIIMLLISIAFFGCKEKYVQPVKENNANYLVVEGLINTGADSTIFNLSRTYKLNSNPVVAPEKLAVVQVESNGGNIYVLPETVKGGKYGASLSLDPSKKYRLRIRTKDNREYLSEFVEAKLSQAFDVKYDFDNDALNFYLDTYDPSGKSIYYLHSYEETWEYDSQIISNFKLENNFIVKRISPKDDVHTCWRTVLSPNIMLSTTANLSEDRIINRSINSVPGKSEKLHIGYSILIKQSVLTPEAFEFWESLRNNTEKVGSIFDVQPSQLFGNIKSLKDPSEIVIGFISAGTVTQKRILLHVADFPSKWFGLPDKTECIESISETKILRLIGAKFVPIDEGTGTDRPYCADCRERGGVTKKPSYWN